MLTRVDSEKLCMNFTWCRTSPAAVPPTKAHDSDSGYDIVLIEKLKEVGPYTFYDTGIKVCPPKGYYFDMVPRSSIYKSGYVMGNTIGVIDQTYTGTIKACLVKIDPAMPDLELPATILQLILRPFVHAVPTEADELEETTRGENGFGSTGG